MEYVEVMKICEQLKEYADLENDELGEVCRIMIDLAGYISYVSDEFYNALIKEIEDKLEFFKENTEIVEKPVTFHKKVRDLEWR